MQIPDYVAKAVYRHLRRIVNHAKCNPADTKTSEAIRLARFDLRKLEKIIKDNERKRTLAKED